VARPGPPPAASPDPAAIVLRYLRAFGPASVADVQTWSGLTGLREVVAGLELRRFADEQGRELLDLPDAPRPDPDAPAPVRFLAEWDNLLFSHADRTRIVAPEQWRALTDLRLPPRAVLVNGLVRATWKIVPGDAGSYPGRPDGGRRTTGRRREARLEIAMLTPLSRRERAEVAGEGARLLEFAATGGTPPGGTPPDRTTPDRTTPDRTTPGRTPPDRTTPDRTPPDLTAPDLTASPGPTGDVVFTDAGAT
jgi:hypothetical protein